MHCRDITDLAFESILTALTDVERQSGAIETASGMHEEFGYTVLLRDGSRCMALVEDPSCLDRALAQMAFASDVTAVSDRARSGRH